MPAMDSQLAAKGKEGILLDTNVFVGLATYCGAPSLRDSEYKSAILNGEWKDRYNAITSANDLYYFCIAPMTLSEDVSIYLRYEYFEYVRQTIQMPPTEMYGDRSVHQAIQPYKDRLKEAFRRERLGEVMQHYNESRRFRELLRPLPRSGDEVGWLIRFNRVLLTLPYFVDLDAGDAQILAAGIAAKVSFLWTTDSAFKRAVSHLQQRTKEFLVLLNESDEDPYFDDVGVPTAESVNISRLIEVQL